MAAYDPRGYWSYVAREIASRSAQNVVAGDDTPFYRYQRDVFVKCLLTSMSVKGQSVLEVGCGPGGNLSELVKNNPSRLVGCDISPDMIDLASSRSIGLPIELLVVDGTSLPFKDAEFDVTFTVTVLQHNQDEMLNVLVPEICRVTKTWIFLFESTSQQKRPSYSFVGRPVLEYATLCTDNGFEFQEVEFLNLPVSERVCSILMGRLNWRGRKEGEPVTTLSVLLQRMVLPMTKILDGAVKHNEGLTKMVFGRRA